MGAHWNTQNTSKYIVYFAYSNGIPSQYCHHYPPSSAFISVHLESYSYPTRKRSSSLISFVGSQYKSHITTTTPQKGTMGYDEASYGYASRRSSGESRGGDSLPGDAHSFVQEAPEDAHPRMRLSPRAGLPSQRLAAGAPLTHTSSTTLQRNRGRSPPNFLSPRPTQLPPFPRPTQFTSTAPLLSGLGLPDSAGQPGHPGQRRLSPDRNINRAPPRAPDVALGRAGAGGGGAKRAPPPAPVFPVGGGGGVVRATAPRVSPPPRKSPVLGYQVENVGIPHFEVKGLQETGAPVFEGSGGGGGGGGVANTNRIRTPASTDAVPMVPVPSPRVPAQYGGSLPPSSPFGSWMPHRVEAYPELPAPSAWVKGVPVLDPNIAALRVVQPVWHAQKVPAFQEWHNKGETSGGGGGGRRRRRTDRCRSGERFGVGVDPSVANECSSP